MPTQQQAIIGYSSLQAAIADQLDRDDLSTVIKMWIQLVEAEVNRNLRHHKMVKRCYTAVHAGDPRVALPADWLEARNIELNGIKLEYVTPDVYDTLRMAQARGESVPTEGQFYTYYDSAFEIWPELSADYGLMMDYYQKIPPLANQVDEINWLLTDSPDVYFYGALRHSAPYLKDDPRIALWSKMYEEALNMMHMTSEKSMVSGSVLLRRSGVCF
jgi:hypothetical protein